jgi:phosphate transport system ATP-binding protein
METNDLSPPDKPSTSASSNPPVADAAKTDRELLEVNAPSSTNGEAAGLDPDTTPKIRVDDLDFWYNADTHALKDITINIPPHRVTALIGPSGCGKSTLLRCMNRMNELIQGTRLEGTIHVDDQDIYATDTDPVMVRRRIGMVFQKPNPFPKTIHENVAWGPRINGYQGDMDALVEHALQQAALWDEVKDRLHTNAYNLSGGQQQRLCIARALAVQPDVILMDEPASALDPIATSRVEETITNLKQNYTIVIVTHNMQQASRISDVTAFLYMGRLIEVNPTEQLFTRPEQQRTEEYITGRFG